MRRVMGSPIALGTTSSLECTWARVSPILAWLPMYHAVHPKLAVVSSYVQQHTHHTKKFRKLHDFLSHSSYKLHQFRSHLSDKYICCRTTTVLNVTADTCSMLTHMYKIRYFEVHKMISQHASTRRGGEGSFEKVA